MISMIPAGVSSLCFPGKPMTTCDQETCNNIHDIGGKAVLPSGFECCSNRSTKTMLQTEASTGYCAIV